MSDLTALPGNGEKAEKARPSDLPQGQIINMYLSLDPTKGGVLTRHGIPWFVQLLMSLGEVDSPDKIESTLDSYILVAEQILKNRGLGEICESGETQEILNLLKQCEGKPEWWAMAVVGHAIEAKRAIEANDARRTAWVMSRLGTSRAMLLFHTTLEKHVWSGYLSAHLGKMLTLWKANEENAEEEFWQKTMAENSVILSQLFSFPTVILQGKAYVGGKSIDNTGAKLADFLLANPLGNNTALVEIKTPMTPLLGREYRADVFPFSPDLAGAITQVLVYKDTLMKDYHSVVGRSREGFNAFDPPCMVIAGNFGREITPEKQASFELFRHSLKGVQIATYDEVFAKIEDLLKLVGV